MDKSLCFQQLLCDGSPNWFDWFSLTINGVISIVSIIGGYLIATKIYSKEKKDKQDEETEILVSQVKLFKNSLTELKKAIDSQISNLKEYIDKKDFRLIFNQSVHSDFLQFVNVSFLYKDAGLEKKEEIDKINSLLSSLYVLNDFRVSFPDEFRSYIKKYNYHEAKFYLYRKLLYTKYYELCNQRGGDFTLENGLKKWQFNNGDTFMTRYTEKRIELFQDAEVINQNGVHDRGKLIERFLVPIIEISADYIPEDYNAIEVNDIGNEVNSAYNDMVAVTNAHFIAADSYLEVLENINNKITKYLQ